MANGFWVFVEDEEQNIHVNLKHNELPDINFAAHGEEGDNPYHLTEFDHFFLTHLYFGERRVPGETLDITLERLDDVITDLSSRTDFYKTSGAVPSCCFLATDDLVDNTFDASRFAGGITNLQMANRNYSLLEDLFLPEDLYEKDHIFLEVSGITEDYFEKDFVKTNMLADRSLYSNQKEEAIRTVHIDYSDFFSASVLEGEALVTGKVITFTDYMNHYWTTPAEFFAKVLLLSSFAPGSVTEEKLQDNCISIEKIAPFSEIPRIKIALFSVSGEKLSAPSKEAIETAINADHVNKSWLDASFVPDYEIKKEKIAPVPVEFSTKINNGSFLHQFEMPAKIEEAQVGVSPLNDAGMKFKQGTLGPDGKIYCAPYDSNVVLVIDPKEKLVSYINSGPAFGSGQGLFWGQALGIDGNVYALGSNNNHILKIDLLASSYSLVMAGVIPDDAQYEKWGGLACGADGCLYGIPFNFDGILKIDVSQQTASILNPVGIDLTGFGKWRGAISHPNGCIYGIPYNHEKILKINTLTGEVELLTPGFLGPAPDMASLGKWNNGVLGPDYALYFSPEGTKSIMRFEVETLQADCFYDVSSFWLKGILSFYYGKIKLFPGSMEVDNYGSFSLIKTYGVGQSFEEIKQEERLAEAGDPFFGEELWSDAVETEYGVFLIPERANRLYCFKPYWPVKFARYIKQPYF